MTRGGCADFGTALFFSIHNVLLQISKLSSGSLGEARLSETPYKHAVRHAVTRHHHTDSHLGERADCDIR